MVSCLSMIIHFYITEIIQFSSWKVNKAIRGRGGGGIYSKTRYALIPIYFKRCCSYLTM